MIFWLLLYESAARKPGWRFSGALHRLAEAQKSNFLKKSRFFEELQTRLCYLRRRRSYYCDRFH